VYLHFDQDDHPVLKDVDAASTKSSTNKSKPAASLPLFCAGDGSHGKTAKEDGTALLRVPLTNIPPLAEYMSDLEEVSQKEHTRRAMACCDLSMLRVLCMANISVCVYTFSH
jgi:hypothetical protein